jgi:hypothetical protein
MNFLCWDFGREGMILMGGGSLQMRHRIFSRHFSFSEYPHEFVSMFFMILIPLMLKLTTA